MLAINHKEKKKGLIFIPCKSLWAMLCRNMVPCLGFHLEQPHSSSFTLCIICWLVPTLIKILHECFSKSFTSLNIEVICKVTLSFTPYPLFQWYLQSKEISLNLSVKCWNSPFNAQEALRKKERGDETQFTTKVGGKTSLGPSYFVL